MDNSTRSIESLEAGTLRKPRLIVPLFKSLVILQVLRGFFYGQKEVDRILYCAILILYKQSCTATERTYNVKNIEITNYADLAEMSTDTIIQTIKPLIERFSQC